MGDTSIAMTEETARSTAMTTTDPTPNGFILEENVVSEEIWKEIEQWMKDGKHNDNSGGSDSDDILPWERAIEGRMVCQWGVRYDYDKQCVDHTNVGPIPQFLLSKLNVDSTEYTQCIINCYNSNDAIPYHLDDLDFGPTVVVYTFGENRPLNFRRRRRRCDSKSTSNSNDSESEEYEYYTCYPNHCSKYILSIDARYEWEHSVPEGHGYRVSITFRSMKMKWNDIQQVNVKY